ncbi:MULTISPECIES: hypothetical protein [Corallococcus]|uniref:hypothetical protein n=1 Tax=Corallococcus TaxID=83461 RepID=UPI00117CC1AB|nr:MULTISPECIES: hypothetical protein [Corallococcus]
MRPGVFIVHPERRHLSPRVRVFVDFVSDAFARPGARPSATTKGRARKAAAPTASRAVKR